MAKLKQIDLPAAGGKAVLVPREQLRCPKGTRRLGFPAPAGAKKIRKPLPTIPPSCDTAQNTSLPILGNNRYGNCFYVACAHAVQIWAGANAQVATFDEAALIARYLKVSGGDNGLDWDTMMREWRSGIIGPNGPHKLLGLGCFNPTDKHLSQTCLYLFGGLVFTMGIPDAWLGAQNKPGGVWDDGPNVRPNPSNGHAVILSGYDERGYYLETWGYDQPILLTYAGLAKCDPEACGAFGLEWFLPDNVSGAGHAYADVRDWWLQLGGDDVPVNPPAPGPGPGPDPGPAPAPLPPEFWQQLLQLLLWLLQLILQQQREGKAAMSRAEVRAQLERYRPANLTPEQFRRLVELLLEALEILFWPPVTSR